VGEVDDVLANRLDIVDPLALDVLNMEDNEPILDILTISTWCAITRRENSTIYTGDRQWPEVDSTFDARYRSGIPVTWYYQSSPLGCFSESDRLKGVQYSRAYQPSWNYGTGERGNVYS
jgi:hypothetical protein